MSILHQGLPNGGYHSDQRDLNIGFQSGGYIGASPVAASVEQAEYFNKQLQESSTRVAVVIDTVENGFVMTINAKKFICTEPKELGDMLIAHMVAQRVSK
jgi:hypothetical protein